ncbi:MAG: hypothetical protein ACI9MX_003815, partial [Candidatus Aldehydirespiratoraceae bacterium]
MSAVLLPHTQAGEIDWAGTEAHIARTYEAGLTPGVNMDTGYVQLLDEPTKHRVLDVAREVTGGAFAAGAFVADEAGASVDLAAYHRAVADIADRGGTPVIFPSHGLNGGSEEDWVAALATIGGETDRFL